MSWKDEGSGPRWVPVLAQAEIDCDIPTDLLARIAYQESTFIEEVIRGIKESSAGARGICQLEPEFFDSVRVSPPYTDEEVEEQITEAADFVVWLHRKTMDWRLTLAAYNAGLEEVEKYHGVPPFPETQKYVTEILKDLPELQT